MFWSRIKCTLALILKFRFEMGLKKAGWYWRWNSRDSMAGVLAGNFSDSERILAVSWELILLSLTVYLFGRLPLWSSTCHACTNLLARLAYPHRTCASF